MSDGEVKKTPWKARVYLILAAICMLLPSAMKFYTGETQRLVVASGKLSDPNFSETVVFIFRHNLDGAIGVVVNRPLTEEQKQRAPGYLRDRDVPLYWGGPVSFPDQVVVLQKARAEEGGAEQLVLRPLDEAVQSDPDFLSKVEASAKAGRDEYRIYLGTSGWGFFQLGMEFKGGDWASTELDESLVFYRDMTPHEVWIRATTNSETKRKPRSPGTI